MTSLALVAFLTLLLWLCLSTIAIILLRRWRASRGVSRLTLADTKHFAKGQTLSVTTATGRCWVRVLAVEGDTILVRRKR